MRQQCAPQQAFGRETKMHKSKSPRGEAAAPSVDDECTEEEQEEEEAEEEPEGEESEPGDLSDRGDQDDRASEQISKRFKGGKSESAATAPGISATSGSAKEFVGTTCQKCLRTFSKDRFHFKFGLLVSASTCKCFESRAHCTFEAPAISSSPAFL